METVPVVEAFRLQRKAFEVSSEGERDAVYARVVEALRALGLDRPGMRELREYVQSRVDPFLKPLVVFLMRTRPADVHAAIQLWLTTEGEEVRKAAARSG